MPGKNRTYYTALEIAKMFGVTRRTVYAWFASGVLQSVKAGPKLRYVTPQQLDRFLQESGRELLPATPRGNNAVAADLLDDLADDTLPIEGVRKTAPTPGQVASAMRSALAPMNIQAKGKKRRK